MNHDWLNREALELLVYGEAICTIIAIDLAT